MCLERAHLPDVNPRNPVAGGAGALTVVIAFAAAAYRSGPWGREVDDSTSPRQIGTVSPRVWRSAAARGHRAPRGPLQHFEPIFEILDRAGARYVIVGGVAVNLHGHQRFTKDLDLALELAGEQLLEALLALRKAGYRPSVPVRVEDFAEPAIRERWIREKNMRVFQMYHDERRVSVDILVSIPLPFDHLWNRAVEVRLEGTTVKVASIEDLIRMKRDAGRAQDMMDIEVLEKIQQLLEEGEGGPG